MAVTPHTQVYLLKCPLEADQLNQLSFSNATAQYNYFNSLPKVELFNFTYQRKDNVIRVPEHIDSIMNYNYVMYRNDNYSNKWFYAFITGMEYSSDHMTYVSIKTDVWQTWQFNIVWKPSFVEREHVSNDTVGLHTVPEPLEYGHYICNSKEDVPYAGTNDGSVVVLFQVSTTDVTIDGNAGAFPSSTYGMHNGIPQGCSVFGIELRMNNTGRIKATCGIYDSAGKGDAIVSISLVPKACCNWSTKAGTGYLSGESYLVPADTTSTTKLGTVANLSAGSTIDGYTPKNKKLLTSPYNYLYVSNNAGADVTYRYEDFTNNTPSFELMGALDQGGSLYLIPSNSRVSGEDGYNEGVPASKLPNISWTSDYYLNWKAQNGKSIAIQTALDGINFASGMIGGMAGGAINSPAITSKMKAKSVAKANARTASEMESAGGGMFGSAMNLAGSIASTAQQIREAKMTPAQAMGNNNAGDFALSHGETKYTFRRMSIKSEYARIIDTYFSQFGYKVNTLKVPNITGRRNWNYVQTIGANIEGEIPQADIEELKAIFNTGVTIWHNPNTFLDYSQTNNII